MDQLQFEHLGILELSDVELLDLEGGGVGKWLYEAAKAYLGEKVIEHAANTLYSSWNTGIGIMSAQGAKSGIIAGM